METFPASGGSSGSKCAICNAVFTLAPVGRKAVHTYRATAQSRSFTFACSGCVTKACRMARRHNRRASKKGIAGKIKPGDWLCVMYAHDFSCAKCSQKVKLTLDHVKPLSKGGMNVWQNIQPLCSSCHFEKDKLCGRAH